MALTTAQEIALFQVLEVPYSATKYTPIDAEGMAMQEYTIADTSYQAYSLITTFVASLSTDAETALVALLTCWINLGVRTTAIVDGSVGNITGINSDPSLDRQEIQRQVRVIVPFYRVHEQIRHDRQNALSVPRIR